LDRIVIKAFMILAVLFLTAAGTGARTAWARDALSGDEYAAEAAEAPSDFEKAVLLKKAGMAYITADDVKKAAESFVEAFSLYRGFPEDERIKMAEYVSWDERFDEASEILLSVLADDPENIRARTMYAKILSWQSRLDESIAEAAAVLERAPGYADALLVKADSLSWSGRYAEAVPIYTGLLKGRESFAARLGLANSLLATGEIGGARESYSLLKPALEWEQREHANLARRLERAEDARRPSVEFAYSYYNDTEFNQVARYRVDTVFLHRDWKINLGYTRSDLRDATRNNSADELRARARTRRGRLTLGAVAGLYRPATADHSSFLTWGVNADMAMSKGSLGGGLSGSAMTDTAELVENGVRYTEAEAHIERDLAAGLSVYGALNLDRYSDSNSSVGLLVAPRYALYGPNPSIALTYRFRYLDFEKQSGGGYFDPGSFTAHQAVARIAYERGRFYSFIEPYYGYQSFVRGGVDTGDRFSGGSALVGYNLRRGLSIEATIEGGNYAVGTAAGFKYYQAGLALHYTLTRR